MSGLGLMPVMPELHYNFLKILRDTLMGLYSTHIPWSPEHFFLRCDYSSVLRPQLIYFFKARPIQLSKGQLDCPPTML